VEIWWDGKLLTRSELKPETRIGTAEGSEVRLPPATGYPPQWAVLAQTNRGWELHSLTAGRFAREGEDVGTDYLFPGGADAVEQGGLRLVFRPPADAGGSGKHDTVMQASTPAPQDTRDSPFYQRCETAYRRAASYLKKVRDGGSAEGVRSGAGLRRFFKWLSRPKDPAEELTRLEQELDAHPGDAATAVELARFFDRIGFDNLYGQLLIDLFRTEPNNVQHLLDLADIYSRRARQTDRPDSSRVQSAVEAYQCLIQAQKLRPDDNSIGERVKRAAAEMTILKGKFGG
jgi:hypothetical protein